MAGNQQIASPYPTTVAITSSGTYIND